MPQHKYARDTQEATLWEMRQAYAADQAESMGRSVSERDLLSAAELPVSAIIAYHEAKQQAQEADEEALTKLCDTAYSEYYRLGTRPRTTPSKADLEPLEQATARYEAICEVIRRRTVAHQTTEHITQ